MVVKIFDGHHWPKQKEMIKMSTPPGHTNLFKNIAWKNQEEKRAFFNKYFVSGIFVKECVDKATNNLKEDVLSFIKHNPKIKEGKTERPLTIKDIQDYVGDA